MGSFRVNGAFRVYGTLYGLWGPVGFMVPFRVYGALEGVWDPLGCIGPFRVYWPPYALAPYKLYSTRQH